MEFKSQHLYCFRLVLYVSLKLMEIKLIIKTEFLLVKLLCTLIKMIQEQQNQFGSTFYNFVPQARPLPKRLPLEFTSVFQFTSLQPNLPFYDKTQPQPIQSSQNNLKSKQIHQIGAEAKKLFAKPVYKFHSQIVWEDNDRLGMTNVVIKEDTKINLDQSLQFTVKNGELQFSSRFQSGNLAIAARSAQNEKSYHLAIHKDTNCKQTSSTQWFYFCVKNRQKIGSFTFNIVNYSKPYSSFLQEGMKPCIYSMKNSKFWQRGGNNIQYRKNSLAKSDGRHYFTLSFTYQFKNKEDQVYFAYCYPYTQTKLFSFLDRMESQYPGVMHRKVIAKSIGGNPVQMLSITNKNHRNKKVIFISARVHPGQTVSSYVCQGFIEFLLSNSEQAQKLKTQYIIRIFPMLNPDGVVNGNYRLSLSGDDLNRQWKQPDKDRHPEIYAVKKMIVEVPYEKLLFIDMHGHSRKKSCFMYGCFDRRNPYTSREFPYILSKKSQNFNYYNCNFSTPKHKQGTSRITIWKQLKLAYSYTLQTSFCCASKSKVHFSVKDYQTIGKELCEVVSLYFCKRKPQKEVQVQDILGTFYNNQDLLEVGQQDSEGSSTDSEKLLQGEYNDQIEQVQIAEKAKVRRVRKQSQDPSSMELHCTTAYIPPHQKKRYFYVRKQEMRKTVKQQAPQPILKHRQFGQKLKIQQLQLEPNQMNNFQVLSRKRYFHQDDSRVYRIDSQTKYTSSQELSNIFNPSVSFKPTTSRNLNGTKDYSSMLFPRVIKNQYTRYQKSSFSSSHNNSTVAKVNTKNISVDMHFKQKKGSTRNQNPSQSFYEIGSLIRYGNKQITLFDKIGQGQIKTSKSINTGPNGHRLRAQSTTDNKNLSNSIDNRYTKYIRDKIKKN